MKKKRRGLVEKQKVSEIRGSTQSYESYVANTGYRNGGSDAVQDGYTEDAQANPDVLPEQDSGPTTPQLVMGEAIEHLQGRQKEVYLLVMREDKSMAEAAEVLNVGKSTVQVYLERAIRFITAYCQKAEEVGRV